MAKKPSLTEIVTTVLEAIMPPRGRRNAEALLFNVCKYQEAKSYADKKLKAAWAALVLEGIVAEDDKLRQEHEPGGPYIVAEDGKFSVTLKVSSGGSSIDPEALTAIMVRRFKVTPERAMKAILDSRKDHANKLEKRVLEAGQ